MRPAGLPRPKLIGRAFAEAWADRDARAIADLFVEDADFVNVDARTRLLGTDVAMVHVPWRITGQVDPHGCSAGDRDGIFVFVLHRQSTGWRAVAAQDTDRVQGADSLTAAAGGGQRGRDTPGMRGASYRG